MATISVIVPVYKVEAYLSRCVDSILAQTYSDFELILVDDGSPDRCGEYCEDYQKADSRVVVLHRENGGLSAARNTGITWALENSRSQFLTFIDSDDWVHPQFLQALYRSAQEHNVPVTVCNHVRADAFQPEELTPLPAFPAVEVMSPEDLLVNHVWNFNYAWGKLYRKDLFCELRYPEGKNFEDTFTTYKALFAGQYIAFLDCGLYFYFKNEAGITRSPWKPSELVVFEGMEQQLAFYREHGYYRALDQEEHLYVNHFAYQLCRIRENKSDFKKNRGYYRKLRREMLRLIRNDSERFGYRKMPQCCEAAFPRFFKTARYVRAFFSKK